MNTSDLGIWQRFIDGDKAAFKKLMEDHYRVLYNYGCKFTFDTDLIRDCIQDLFFGLWNRKVFLSREVNPKAYLISSLRRTLHRKLKSGIKMLHYQESFIHQPSFDFEISIEEKVIKTEAEKMLSDKLAEMIAALPRRQKEVIYLKYFLNLTRDEIALVMGNNPQTVSNLLQLALKKLRNDPATSGLTISQVVIFAFAYF